MNNNKLEYHKKFGFFIDITNQYKNLPIKKIKKICEKEYFSDYKPCITDFSDSHDIFNYFFVCICQEQCSLGDKYNRLIYSFNFNKIICIRFDKTDKESDINE
ncbi:hypothetical protein M0R19_03815 [Candidatus Pacearchaeota archaeon]|jgi:hypothetical protein|nr:hypothetical protein [Candidatus Pacearchaeota archaeon]